MLEITVAVTSTMKGRTVYAHIFRYKSIYVDVVVFSIS